MENTLDSVLTAVERLAKQRVEESRKYSHEDRIVVGAIHRYLTEEYKPFNGRWEHPLRNPVQTVRSVVTAMLGAAKRINRTRSEIMRLLEIDARQMNRFVGEHAIDDTHYSAGSRQGKTVIAIRNVADTIAHDIYNQLY